MNLVMGLHQLLIEIEEDLGESRLLFGKGEHCLVHHLQPQGSRHSLALLIGDAKMHPSFTAWKIARCVCFRLDAQLFGWVHEDEPLVRNLPAIPANQISTDRKR